MCFGWYIVIHLAKEIVYIRHIGIIFNQRNIDIVVGFTICIYVRIDRIPLSKVFAQFFSNGII
jgi:hypothetical protein